MTFAPRIDNIDKNYLINGGMDLFQRSFNTTVNLGTSFAYQTADRWALQYAGTFSGTPTSKSDTAIPDNGSKYSLLFNGNASVTNSEVDLRQRLESIISAELSGRQISVGFWINSESPSQAILEIRTPQGLDNWTTSTLIYNQTKTFSVGGWELVTFDGITLPATQNGLEIRLRLTNWTVLAASKNVWISQVGLTRTPTFDGFNRHGGTIITEIQACQRYFEKSYDMEVNVGGTGGGGQLVFQQFNTYATPAPFKVTKRAIPTAISWSPVSGNPNVVYDASVAGDASVTVAAIGQSGIGEFALSGAQNNHTLIYHWSADAEL